MKESLEAMSAIGNPAIRINRKLALFCSVKCPGNLILKTYELAKSLRDKGITVISGFHSPLEQEVLNILLKGTQSIIICPARSIENMRIPRAWKSAIDAGRLLIISPFAEGNNRMTRKLAEERNRFVAEKADAVFIAYAAPKSGTERLCKHLIDIGKTVFTFCSPENVVILGYGAKAVKTETNWEIFL